MKRLSRLRFFVITGGLLLLWPTVMSSCGAERQGDRVSQKPNVLFIAVDDLNDWIGALGGHPQAKTPNLDSLAESGLTFTRAYCVSPACGPSRAALLYGRLPSTIGAYGHQNGHDPRRLINKTVLSLPQKFQRNGYYVAGCGKIFHGKWHDERRWDEYLIHPRSKRRKKKARVDDGSKSPKRQSPVDDNSKSSKKGSPEVVDYPFKFGPIDNVTDDKTNDMKLAEWAAKRIRAKREKPFFIAVGFRKPHLPWRAPRKYFDLHPLKQVKVPEVPAEDLEDVPPIGRFIASMASRLNRPEKSDHHEIVRLGLWRRAVQAYLATCSYADACVGYVIRALEESGRGDDTIVVVWGDNGWHLGEKLHWRKGTLWEESTRIPLLMRVPSVTAPGTRCDRTVMLQDLYPTLVDLCGLPPQDVEARNIRPLLENPSGEWPFPAVTTLGPNNHSVRDERWRFTRYADGSEELYDHDSDPGEHVNLAADEKYSQVKKRLSKWLPVINHPDPAPDSSFNVLKKF